MRARSLLALGLMIGVFVSACGREPRAISPLGVRRAPVPPTVGRYDALYRSGSRLKIRWIEPVDGSTALPFAIYDSKLKTDCTIARDEATCIPVGEIVDDEKLAYLTADEKSPALVVDDSECAAPKSTKADEQLWTYRTFLPNEKEERFRLDPAQRPADAWTLEGPDCVVHVQKNARGPLCVRPLRKDPLTDVASVHAMALGAKGNASGVMVIATTDGAILPRANPQYFDAANDIHCALDVHEDRCFPAPYQRIKEKPVVGNDVVVEAFSFPMEPWGDFEDGDRKIWAKISQGAALNSQLLKVLGVLDDTKVVQFPEVFEGKSRLTLHERTMPDGHEVPLSFYDNVLKRDCVAKQTSDGTWRCVVELPSSCQDSRVVENGVAKDVLIGSTSFCREDKNCCAGGAVWFEGHPARPPRRFGMDARMPLPAEPEHGARYAEVGHIADHIEAWQPQIRRLVYDKIEDLDASTFATLKMVQDP